MYVEKGHKKTLTEFGSSHSVTHPTVERWADRWTQPASLASTSVDGERESMTRGTTPAQHSYSERVQALQVQEQRREHTHEARSRALTVKPPPPCMCPLQGGGCPLEEGAMGYITIQGCTGIRTRSKHWFMHTLTWPALGCLRPHLGSAL